ncbi:AhpC/TSA family protein [Dysgonomonas sp. 511]|nr:AhpC/TSA family protein [Dysgonomonas sp. 511]
MFSCKKKDKDIFSVEGTLENVEGSHFYTSYEVGDSVQIDTIAIGENGKFSFTGKVDTLTVMSLYFNNNTKNIFILVNKGWNIQMEGDALYPDLIDIKGGKVNDDLTEFKNKNKELLKMRADILMAVEDENTENDSLPVKNYVAELRNTNFELSNIAASYIKANPEKVASVMLANAFFKDESSIPRLDESLNLFKGRALDFPMTEELRRYRDKVKKSAVGSYAPLFTAEDIKGKEVKLVDYRDKYVLLSFAATTCDVCKDEKKDAIKVYNDLKKQKKNIEFVTVVKDIETVPLSKNISDSVKWTILPVKGGWSASVFDTYYIRGIPYHILISPRGYILERDISLDAIAGKIESLEPKDKK